METASTMQKQFDREWNRECNKDWNKDWVDFGKLAPGTEYAQSYKSSTVKERDAKGLHGKTVTEKKELKDGKQKTIKT